MPSPSLLLALAAVAVFAAAATTTAAVTTTNTTTTINNNNKPLGGAGPEARSLPFSLTLQLSVASEARAAEAGAEEGSGAEVATAQALQKVADALNGSLADARRLLQVRLESVWEEQTAEGARSLRVRLVGRLPAPAPVPANGRRWMDDVDTSPTALANLLLEMAATLVGLSWGVYSMWLAG